MSDAPSGSERKVQFLGGAAIDGAPVAYVVVLAAVITALSFIPFSVTLGGGGGAFPVSQAVIPLAGIILGPIAGAVATGIGTLIGVFVAPHTAGAVPIVTVLGGMTISFTSGLIRDGEKRSKWWLIPFLVGVVGVVLTAYLAIFRNGADVGIYLAANAITILALVLFGLPTRKVFARWLASSNIALVAAGIFIVTYVGQLVGNMWVGALTYTMFAWPNEVWSMLIVFMPLETFMRCLVGTVIGTGVIAGLRAIGVTKSEWALY